MNDLWKALLESMPDYDRFFTVDELDESARRLSEEYPNTVSLFILGESKGKSPITGLKIGSGSKNALVFGCPHPNEPIGAMMMEHFTRSLAANASLRETLDYTWYFVKVWDVDGTRLNEGWFHPPFTLRSYARHFYRPVEDHQVDWTFPLSYKHLDYQTPLPETAAMQRLIDEIKPYFIYALHNACFGGVYWYLTEEKPTLFPSLYEAAARSKIPLHGGEPEAPFAIRYKPAIFKNISTADGYDFLESHGANMKMLANQIKRGDSSASYAASRYGSVSFLTELPYFINTDLANDHPAEHTRGEVLRLRKKIEAEIYEALRKILQESVPYLDCTDPFMQAVCPAIFEVPGEPVWANGPDYLRLATIAEETDGLLLSRFFCGLTVGQVLRAHEHALCLPQTATAHKVLQRGLEETKKMFDGLFDALERELPYTVASIRTLASLQLECGLLLADALHTTF